jgi:hypothetical protein
MSSKSITGRVVIQLEGRDDHVQGMRSVSRLTACAGICFVSTGFADDSAVLCDKMKLRLCGLTPLAVESLVSRRKSSCQADREYAGCIKVAIYVEQVSAYPICVSIYI